jgi:hypothetical protein
MLCKDLRALRSDRRRIGVGPAAGTSKEIGPALLRT